MHGTTGPGTWTVLESPTVHLRRAAAVLAERNGATAEIRWACAGPLHCCQHESASLPGKTWPCIGASSLQPPDVYLSSNAVLPQAQAVNVFFPYGSQSRRDGR